MRKEDFTKDWLFSKQGSDEEKKVRLPHDAMIEENRRPDAPSASAGAFFPGGVYHYRKVFFVPDDWKHKTLLLEFEGVYKDSEITINGNHVLNHAYGYTPFTIDLNNYLQFGQQNEIIVTVDNSQHPNSRWYTGSGIYRPVWLYIGEQSHIRHQGVKITTLNHSPAQVKVETDHTASDVEVRIFYKDKLIDKKIGNTVTFDIEDPKLWSAETPHLYDCEVTLVNDGIEVDSLRQRFGIRTITWSKQGFFVNGKETLLRGGCVHSDNGILGAASHPESEQRRVRIMKQAGYNAIRSSHNLASKAMIEACDEQGMYLIDETWDTWFSSKTTYDYSKQFLSHYQSDIKTMIERDYNHPSVIMYSIGNEVTEPAHEKGITLLNEMVDYAHQLDQTRPVTCGVNLWLLYQASKGKGVYEKDDSQSNKKSKEMNSTVFNMIASKVGTKINNGAKSKKAGEVIQPALDALDIAGYNYSSGRYPIDSNRIIVGSETYPQDIYKNWEMVKQYPYLVGDFVWTSWDYLGEVGLGAWAYSDDGARFDKPFPWLLADTGTIDILGTVGAQADYAAVVWGQKDKPAIHVRPVNHANEKPSKMVWRGTNAMPSWSWKNCEGNKAFVEVYSQAYSVELVLNGKVVGKKRLKEAKAYFKLRYQPGTLTAIAYDREGHEQGRSELISARGETKLSVTTDNQNIECGKIAYIDVALVGENGEIEYNDDKLLAIKVEGGELLAFGSANPRTEEVFHSGEYTTYYGRAQAVVRSHQHGTMTVTLAGENIEKETLAFEVTGGKKSESN